jgi:hypothetical protein
MMIIGAMMLLSQMALTIKGSILGMQDVSYENEAILAATSIARSVVREAAAKNFDEQTVGKGVTTTDSLTLPVYLGYDAGETYPAYDDVDDFNGLTRTVTTDRLGDFTVNVTVNYTTAALLGAPSFGSTFMKAISVEVSANSYLMHNVSISTIVAY